MDLAFIRFYLNDFEGAKQSDDSNDVRITKYAYIQLLPCGVISQFTKVKEGISFVGGIKVELINDCGIVLQDVSNFFAYDTFIQDGLPQINWEFGKVGKDYYYKPLFLKITDLVNENVYYSSRFLMTNMDSELSTNFVYTENTRFRGIPYDIKPFYQQVRFYKCFYKDSANTSNLKEYTQTSGRIMNYRNITTFIKSFIFDKLDIAIDNRLYEMFAHSVVYANGERVKLQEYNSEEVVGDTNWKTASFKLNPQDESLTLGLQVLEPLQIEIVQPIGRYEVDGVPNDMIFSFNKPTTLGSGTIKIFDEFNALIATFTEANVTETSGDYYIDLGGIDFEISSYYVIISEGLFKGEGCFNFSIINTTDWTFEVSSAQYNKPQYSNQYS